MENNEDVILNEGDSGHGFKDRRFPKSYFMPKPVKVDEELDVDITETSKKGDGMTRIKGYVIFVPKTKVGDKVRIKITQIRPNHALGEVI